MSTTTNGAATVDEGYDVVVIGGGAAGLSGALTLVRAGRSVLVVDAGEQRNGPASGVHNYLGREGTPPAELMADGRREVAGYGGRTVSGRVEAARRTDAGFAVRLADGTEARGRRLLVTTGVVDELPPVPGVAERWGRDVLHCPFCHGHEVRGEAIGILGTGPMAVHQALMWRGWSADVTLFRHTGPEPTEQQREELAARDIRVVEGEVIGLEVTDDRLTGVRLADGRAVPRQALVVATRLTARAGFLADLGLDVVPAEAMGQVMGTRVPAQFGGATSVPGVWVAGNVTEPFGQVIGAASAGMTAGAAIQGDLLAEETRDAVAARRAAA